MDLSIIIVSWNVKEKLRENLLALQAGQGGLGYEIFVVDNDSADYSAEMIKKEFPKVKLIANSKNLGFARANNQAIRKAQGDFILLLNPDMRVFSDTLKNMVEWMRENEEVSVTGCHLVDEKGRTVKQVRKFPTLLDQLAITLKLPHIFPWILNKYLQKDFDYSQEAKVDSIRGSFFMIRKETIEKIGLLDEKYFIWFEEVDYCKRVKQAGLKVWYTPVARCFDYVGQSFSQLPQGKKQKYFRNSQLFYFKKHCPIWQYWILKLAWVSGMIISWVGERLGTKNRVKM